MSLIPGHCQDANLLFIQIFDSSVNVTPVLQSAEAESQSVKPCCVCSCLLVCDYVAYSGLQGLLSWLTVICFPLHFLPPGINFTHAAKNCVGSFTRRGQCLILFLFTFLTCHLLCYDFLPNITPPLISPLSTSHAHFYLLLTRVFS